jgi:S-(hydroxymethyl)glutathione dehydrogenase/alcohol dehydrogenase
LAKVRKDARNDKDPATSGCGVTTGIGAVINTKVEIGARCVVFGLGGILG